MKHHWLLNNRKAAIESSLFAAAGLHRLSSQSRITISALVRSPCEPFVLYSCNENGSCYDFSDTLVKIHLAACRVMLCFLLCCTISFAKCLTSNG